MPRWPAYLLAGAAAAFALPAMTTPHPRETSVAVAQDTARADPQSLAADADRPLGSERNSQE